MPRLLGRAILRRLAPGLVLLALLPGCAYFNTYTNARKFYKEAEEIPLDPQGNVTAQARKKYDDSIAKCQKLLDLYPDSKYADDALFLMSRAYFNKKEYRSCLRRLDELDERFPKNPYREESLYMRGICILEDGDESRAIAELQKLADEYPKSEHLAEGLFRTGEAEFRINSWADAIDSYQVLLDRFEKSDWNDEARLQMARAYRELDQDSTAIVVCDELKDKGREPRKVFEGQLLKAQILLDNKRYRESQELLETLEKDAINFQLRPEVLLLRAEVIEAQGESDSAITLLENIATEFPRSVYAAESWYRIGLIRQLVQGDLQLAMEAYDQVAKEDPRSLFMELSRAKRSAISEHLSVQQEFGESPPDSSAADMQFRLAENLFLRLEDAEGAIPEYQRVLDEYPASALAPSAAYALCYIYRYVLSDEQATLEAVAVLRERYPESEAAAFVEGWEKALREQGGGP